jgi:hypothetical protein
VRLPDDGRDCLAGPSDLNGQIWLVETGLHRQHGRQNRVAGIRARDVPGAGVRFEVLTATLLVEIHEARLQGTLVKLAESSDRFDWSP